MGSSKIGSRLSAVLLAFGALYYLQFGLQAFDDHLSQASLTVVGAIVLGLAAVLRYRGQRVATLVLVGTAPLMILHILMTIEDPGEMIFLIGSAVAPVSAAAVLLVNAVGAKRGRIERSTSHSDPA